MFLEYPLPTLYPTGFIRSITIARATTVLFVGVPLVLLVYWWLAREAGPLAAGTGTALLALSPNIVANTAIATTDLCFVLFALVALAALRAWIDAPSRSTFIALALGVGAAMAAKYSAVGLFAVVPIAWLAVRARADARPAALWRAVLQASAITLALVATTFLIMWALHGFGSAGAVLPWIGAVHVPAPLAGFIFQVNHQRGGHFAFLLGKLSTTGWWYYMPIALALKSTPAELVVMAAGLYALATGWRTCSVSSLVWRVAFIVYGGLALVSRVDAGVRYVLVLVPLASMLACERWLREAGSGRARLRAAAVALVLLHAVSAFRIAPHYLSYFNFVAGGPAQGWRSLADSNIDWGQDLPALRDVFARVGARRPLFAYFGTAPPEEYGVSATSWTRGRPPDGDWIAISVTYLDGVYIGNDGFAPFRALTPSARAGYSIFVYDGRRPDVQQAFEAAAARLP